MKPCISVVRYTVNYGVTDDHAARHGAADLLVVLVDVVCYLLCKFSLSCEKKERERKRERERGREME